MTNQEKTTARIVGALFIIAIVTSLLGGGLMESVLDTPDYLTNVYPNKTQLLVPVLLELINGIAVVGIAVMFYPILKRHNEALALGYVAFRIIEAVIIVGAVISPLALVALSQEYSMAGASDASAFRTLGTSLIAVRTYLAGQLLGIFFSLGALLLYTLLYQSRLVPRFISVWGLIAVAAVFTWNLLELLGLSISAGIVFGLPIILNELFLGVWLIVRGFNSSAIVADSIKEDSGAVQMAKSR